MSDPVEYEEEEYDIPGEEEEDEDLGGSSYDDYIDDDEEFEEDEDPDDEEEGDTAESKGADSPPPEKEEKPEEKTYRIKIRGEELDVTQEELAEAFNLKETPMTDELADVLVDARQKQLAGMQALTESGRYRKQIGMFFEELKSNPMKVLLDPDLGIDFDRLAEERVIEKVKYELMSPEERRLHDLEKKAQEYEQRERQQMAEQQAAAYERETQGYMEAYGNGAVEALRETGLPETEYVFQRVVAHMTKQYQSTGIDPNPKAAAAAVRKELEETVSHFGRNLTPEQIAQVFGTEGRQKMRRYEIDSVKKNRIPKQAEPGKNQVGRQKKPKYINEQEFSKILEKRYGSL